jgi:hypothetical protein
MLISDTHFAPEIRVAPMPLDSQRVVHFGELKVGAGIRVTFA